MANNWTADWEPLFPPQVIPEGGDGMAELYDRIGAAPGGVPECQASVRE